MTDNNQNNFIDKEGLKLKIQLEVILKQKEADLMIEKERTKQADLVLQQKLLDGKTRIEQIEVNKRREESRKRPHISLQRSTKRIKRDNQSLINRSTTSTNSQSTANTLESTTSSSEYGECDTSDNRDFYNRYMNEKMYSFDICSLLKNDGCLLDDNLVII